MRTASIAMVVSVTVGGHATGQTRAGFAGIELSVGDPVVISRPDAADVVGRISLISDTHLIVKGHQIEPTPDLHIDRFGDPVVNGLYRGAAIGLMVGRVTLPGQLMMNAAFGATCHERGRLRCIAGITAVSAALGGVVDRLRVERTRVFSGSVVRTPEVTITPHLERRRFGLHASVRWK